MSSWCASARPDDCFAEPEPTTRNAHTATKTAITALSSVVDAIDASGLPWSGAGLGADGHVFARSCIQTRDAFCDRPGRRSSRPATREQNRCGASSWRHAATAARRRARHAEVLGARGCSGCDRAGSWTPRDHHHCADRGDFHSDAARGLARQVHTPLWLHGSAPDDHRDGRCGPTTQPILRVAAGRECQLRCGDWRGTLADRRTVRCALGGAGRSAAIRPLPWAAAGGSCPR